MRREVNSGEEYEIDEENGDNFVRQDSHVYFMIVTGPTLHVVARNFHKHVAGALRRNIQPAPDELAHIALVVTRRAPTLLARFILVRGALRGLRLCGLRLRGLRLRGLR